LEMLSATTTRQPVFSLCRALRLSSCLLITALPLRGAQSSGDFANSITAALRADDYNQALQLARVAIEHSPKDAEILTLEAMALTGLGRNPQALAAYDTALGISPNYLPALEGAAQIEYNAGSNRAVALLDRILKIHPQDPTAQAMLGVLAYKGGDCPAAVEHFRASGEVVFSKSAAIERYGFCLMRLNRAKDAIPVYQRAVAAEPEDSRARLHLAAAQYVADQPHDAIATLRPVLDGGNASAEILDVASAAYEKTGDTPRAVELLRQAIVLKPDNPKYYLAFSTLCFDHASFQVGIDMLNVGLRQLPSSAPLYVARGILYIQLGDFEKGQADFEMAERLDPRQAFSSESESLTKLQQSNLDEALRTVRARLRNHPDDAFLRYLLAEVLDREGAAAGSPQFGEAVESLSVAIRLQPDLILARDLLSGFYLKGGNLDKAIEQSRAALRYDPSDQVALYHLTQALRKSGRREEIPELLKRLAALRQDSRKQEALRNQYKLVEIPESEENKR
jgi:tetratricopeptide (TPR) repeat protein